MCISVIETLDRVNMSVLLICITVLKSLAISRQHVKSKSIELVKRSGLAFIFNNSSISNSLTVIYGFRNVFQIFDLSENATVILQVTLACHVMDYCGRDLQCDDWFLQLLSMCIFTKRQGLKEKLRLTNSKACSWIRIDIKNRYKR